MPPKTARKPRAADTATPVRAVLVLHKLGWTADDIAAGLKVSKSTVYARLKTVGAIARERVAS